MRKRGIAVLWVLTMGVVFPLLLVSVLKNELVQNKTQSNSDETKNVIAEESTIKISVLSADGSVVAMDLNEYLVCVLLEEMPASFELEALKAQSVVARTYTLRRLENESKHNFAVVCMDSSCCQGFRGIDDYLNNGGKTESVEKVREAVRLTENLVVTYKGDLIDATYFSCSGGCTEDALAVWGADIPYLKATQSPGEEKSVHYVDTVTFKTDEFLKLLELNTKENAGRWIEDISYTSGGGVDEIMICGTVFSGTEIRRLLGLKSTAFRIAIIGNTVAITTKGFGHRVGMSQYGADAMAVSGATFEQILMHYYADTRVTQYNGN